jgi:hypothetical protein
MMAAVGLEDLNRGAPSRSILIARLIRSSDVASVAHTQKRHVANLRMAQRQL